MSSSAAALVWRRTLRDALLRGSACRGAAPARYASTASASGAAAEAAAAAAPKKVPPPPRKGRFLTGAMIALAIGGGAYVSTADEGKFCGWLFKSTELVNPLFALLDAEFAHSLAVKAAAHGFVPREKRPDPPVLGLEVWGRKFANPIGLAAGFDKNAEAVEGLLGMGFGFVEVGSVTPLPQEGNPKPRIFRLKEHGAVINRCGFNSEGIVVVAKRLGAQHGRKQLKDLVKKVQAARDEMQWAEDGPPPLLVKIAPDLSKQDLEDIAAVALALRLDGLIISNTTVSRPPPADKDPLAQETGGLSGKPLFDLSTNILREMYMLTRGKIPLIGCGGVSSGEDAYKKIRSGATLVQLYTALAYGGPALIPRMKAELAECLERDGFKSVQEAVGADFR
ncbi:unnamed protein product [Miscanthus lutarioriparius]|uniref:Dihydroorotate dehydrogenase (quinone), mitochondrial n=1 Tax=Miscanthus lutarioriparius TaxID=422564 RepID=A0A811QSU6_9POAL|nr:unnamed protein product [Miscanthus lutarioriparius]